MNSKIPFLNLLRNDWQRFRGWFAVWAALLLLSLLLAASLSAPWAASSGYWEMVQRFLPLSLLLRVLFAWVLVIQLVQKESTAAKQAYWKTRPLGGTLIFLEKLALLIAVVVLPDVIAVTITHVVVLGWPGWDALGQAFLLSGLLMTLVPLISANFFRTTATALLAPIGLFFLLAIIGSVAKVALNAQAFELWSFRHLPPGFPATTLLSLLALAAVAAIVWWRYQRPKRCIQAALWLAAPLGLVMLPNVVEVAPALPKASAELPDSARPAIEGYTYKYLRKGPFTMSTNGSSSPDAWDARGAGLLSLEARLEWEGLPDTLITQSEVARSYGPDGERWPISEERPFFHNSIRVTAAALEKHFPEYKMVERPGVRHRRELALFKNLPAEAMPPLPVEASLELATTLYEPEAREVPLASGQGFAFGEASGVISRVSAADGINLQLKLVAQDANATFEQKRWYLLDRAKRHIHPGNSSSSSRTSVLSAFSIGGMSLSFPSAAYPPEAFEPGGAERLAERFRLVYLTLKPTGTARTELSYRIPEAESEE